MTSPPERVFTAEQITQAVAAARQACLAKEIPPMMVEAHLDCMASLCLAKGGDTATEQAVVDHLLFRIQTMTVTLEIDEMTRRAGAHTVHAFAKALGVQEALSRKVAEKPLIAQKWNGLLAEAGEPEGAAPSRPVPPPAADHGRR